MNNDKSPKIKEIQIEYTYIQCANCMGYGTKGFNRVICPSCKGRGVLQVPVKEDSK